MLWSGEPSANDLADQRVAQRHLAHRVLAGDACVEQDGGGRGVAGDRVERRPRQWSAGYCQHPGRLLGRRRKPDEAPHHRVGDGPGHGVVRRQQDLLGEEGIAGGAAVQLCHRLVVELVAERERHRRQALLGQRPERDLVRVRPPEQIRQCAGILAARPVDAETDLSQHQDARIRQLLDDRAQRGDAGGIEALRILDRHQHRSGRILRRDQLGHRRCDCRRPIVADRRRARRDRAEVHGHARLDAERHERPAVAQVGRQLLGQPRLADAGLTGHHHELRQARLDRGGHPPEELEIALALDQHRAHRHHLRWPEPRSAVVVRGLNLDGGRARRRGEQPEEPGTGPGTFVPSGPMSHDRTLPA